MRRVTRPKLIAVIAADSGSLQAAPGNLELDPRGLRSESGHCRSGNPARITGRRRAADTLNEPYPDGSYRVISAPVTVGLLEMRRSEAGALTSENSRRPVPRTRGWITSMNSSMRSWRISVWIKTPLPMMTRSWSGRRLSAATSSAGSPCSSVVFGHGAGARRVVDTTYFGALLSPSLNGLSCVFQYPAFPRSYGGLIATAALRLARPAH